jgi:hypothetical protein
VGEKASWWVVGGHVIEVDVTEQNTLQWLSKMKNVIHHLQFGVYFRGLQNDDTDYRMILQIITFQN